DHHPALHSFPTRRSSDLDSWTTSFNIYSQVGLVTLVGLVSKNGILIVQFANERQRAGLNKLAAVAEAARIRLRPIMMTSVATVRSEEHTSELQSLAYLVC